MLVHQSELLAGLHCDEINSVASIDQCTHDLLFVEQYVHSWAIWVDHVDAHFRSCNIHSWAIWVNRGCSCPCLGSLVFGSSLVHSPADSQCHLFVGLVGLGSHSGVGYRTAKHLVAHGCFGKVASVPILLRHYGLVVHFAMLIDCICN